MSGEFFQNFENLRQSILPYFANTTSSHMDLWELFESRKEYFLTVITPLLLSLDQSTIGTKKSVTLNLEGCSDSIMVDKYQFSCVHFFYFHFKSPN